MRGSEEFSCIADDDSAGVEFHPAEVFMYTATLILSMLAVVLSPLLLDLFLSVREMQYDRHRWTPTEKKSPRVLWASFRLR